MVDPYRDDRRPAEPSETFVREAVRAWARSVPGAPRRLDEQITAIDVSDNVLVRVATEIVRRDPIERRVAAHPRTQRVDKTMRVSTIDPFAGSPQDLRAKTEHSEQCASCRGTTRAGCPTCSATGQAPCGVCGGSGRTYARSTRGAKCKACRETGRVQCPRCGGTAEVACEGCAGTGSQLVYWDYVESVRVVVTFLRETPLLTQHGYLREQRFLSARDLAYFTPFVTIEHPGPIPYDALEREDADALARISPPVKPGVEQVRAQQLVRFGVVQRDVRYEMCGTTGTITLSGATLLGASTKKALHPIHLRLALLAAISVILIVLVSHWGSTFGGPTEYFAASNRLITVVLIVSVIAAVAAASTTLRRLRPGFRWWPSTRFERVSAAAFVAAFASAPLIAFISRPTVAEVRAGIAAGDLERAELVLEALKATRPSADVRALSEELILAEAERLTGDARIAKLQEAAALPGPHTGEERARALRAEAYDQMAAACKDVVCRFTAARSADAAQASPARGQALGTARQELLAALDPKVASDPDALRRLRALRAAAGIGGAVLAATPDEELSKKAAAAASAVEAELSRVLLIGAPVAVVNDVLARPAAGSALTGWRELEGVAVYLADTADRCAGLYVVGAAAGSRSLLGKEPGLRRLLAQATGHPAAAIRDRPKSPKEHEVSTWTEGSTKVSARWRGEVLMELRIGAAAP